MLVVRENPSKKKNGSPARAGDRIRTDDNNVGNVVLYQLSYARTSLLLPDYRFSRSLAATDVLITALEGQIIGLAGTLAREP